MAPPTVTLQPVAEEDKAALASLIQLYRHDFSGLDDYLAGSGRYAFLVRVDGRLGGFALARRVGHEHEVAELFVVRRYRRTGVGRAAALSLFTRLPGRWTLFHDDADEPAARFWDRVVAEASSGLFECEQITTPAGLLGRRYRFRVPSSSGGAPFIPLPDGLRDPRRMAGRVFDRIADLYDRARPGYPADAIEDLVRTCAVTDASRIVEVGCGTGQLTRALVRTGASILAVEPGGALATFARANLAGYPAVEVRTTRFEDLEAPPAGFDLVVAATSFHWVDPALGYRKAADLLRSGGFLALLTNAHAAGGNHTDPPFAAAVRQLHRRLAPAIGDWTFPTAEQIAHRATAGGDLAGMWARIDRNLDQPPTVSQWFETPAVRTYPWLATYDRDGYLDMLASQSSYALMEADQRAGLLEGIGSLVDDLLGGRVTEQYLTVLATARTR